MHKTFDGYVDSFASHSTNRRSYCKLLHDKNNALPKLSQFNTCVLQSTKTASPSKVSEESKENWNGGSALPLCSSVTNTDSRNSMIPPVHDLKSSIPSVSSLTCLMPPVSLGSQSDLTCLLDDEGSKNNGTCIATYIELN